MLRPSLFHLLALLPITLTPACSGGSSDGDGTGGAAGNAGSGATGGAAGSGGGGGSGGSSGSGGGGGGARLALTADWLAGSLSIVDVDALVDGATSRDDALVDTIDLGGELPGPLEVEVTPDGRRALAAVSPGFFDGVVGTLAGIMNVPAGDGALVIVDLEARAVEKVLHPEDAPMGIAIHPDGTRAYTANFGSGTPGDTLSIIDLDTLEIIEDVVVGERPEQVALNDDGTLGIFNTTGDGSIRTFRTDDVAGSLSAPLAVAQDPSDVVFIPGTTRAVVADSLVPNGWTIVDVSDPANPTLVEETTAPAGAPYGVTWIPGTTEVFLPMTTIQATAFHVVDAVSSAAPIASIDAAAVGFPLGAAITDDGETALVALAGDDVLLVVDLASETVSTVDWLDSHGPTYVALMP